MSTFAERRKSATPAEITVHLCLDLRLHDEFRQAYEELRRLQMTGGHSHDDDEQTLIDDASPTERRRRAAERLNAAAEAVHQASEPYVFRKLRRHEWRDLVEAHPPTEEDLERWRKQREDDPQAERPGIDAETFWPVALSRCSHDPKLTEDDVRWLRDGDDPDPDDEDAEGWPGLPEGEFDRMCTDLAGLHGRGAVPKDLLDTVRTLRRGRSGTTPAPAASRSASSGAGSRKKGKPTG